MITYNQIRSVVVRMTVLGNQIRQLQEILPKVIRLSERITSLNQELMVERDKMAAEIRAIEPIEEVLKNYLSGGNGQRTSAVGGREKPEELLKRLSFSLTRTEREIMNEVSIFEELPDTAGSYLDTDPCDGDSVRL